MSSMGRSAPVGNQTASKPSTEQPQKPAAVGNQTTSRRKLQVRRGKVLVGRRPLTQSMSSTCRPAPMGNPIASLLSIGKPKKPALVGNQTTNRPFIQQRRKSARVAAIVGAPSPSTEVVKGLFVKTGIQGVNTLSALQRSIEAKKREINQPIVAGSSRCWHKATLFFLKPKLFVTFCFPPHSV